MRFSTLLCCIPLFALLAPSCATSSADTPAPECTDDTECGGNDVCSSRGQCIPFKGGGGTGGDGVGGSGSTTASTGSGFSPAAKEICQEYLGCLAVVSPEQVANALPTYGVDGSCWTADAQTAETCGVACFGGMKAYHDASPTDCSECYVDGDCDYGVCDQGSCLVTIEMPDTSAQCTACRDVALAGPCSSYAEQCADEPDCLAVAACVGACNGDEQCVFEGCYQDHPQGGELYFYGVMSCVVCQECTGECNFALFCGGG